MALSPKGMHHNNLRLQGGAGQARAKLNMNEIESQGTNEWSHREADRIILVTFPSSFTAMSHN